MRSASRLVWQTTFLLLVLHSGFANAQIRWTFDAGARVIGKPTIEGGSMYIAGGSTLHVLDLDGKEIWSRQLEGQIAARIRVVKGVIYVHSSSGVYALNGRGETMWRFEQEDRGPLVDGRTWGWGAEVLPDPWGWYRSAPLIGDSAVYFGSSDGLYAVSASDGAELWHAPLGPVTADVLSYQDTIITACWNNSIYAVDAESGEVRWRFRGAVPATTGVDWIGYSSFHLTPVLDGDRLYAGNRGTYFYAVDASDGSEVWSSKVGSSWIGSPAIVTENAVYYGLSDGAAVLGYEKARGAQRFFFDTGSLVFAQPELYGKRLIVGTLAGHLFSLDPETGTGERLISLGSDGFRYREFFDPKKIPDDLKEHEATVWTVDHILTENNGILNLTVHEGTAYVGTASGVLYAVDLEPSE